MLTSVATLASILWVGVALPEVPFVSALDPVGRRSMTISLESALLGVYDPAGRHASATATAALLGLARDSRLPSPARLRVLASQLGDPGAASGPLVVAARSLASAPAAEAGAASASGGGRELPSEKPENVADISADIGSRPVVA